LLQKYISCIKTQLFSITNVSLMLFREILAASENHTKHINTFGRLNAQLLNAKGGGIHSNHCAFRRSTIPIRCRGTCLWQMSWAPVLSVTQYLCPYVRANFRSFDFSANRFIQMLMTA
jgi:hypothetical protein